MKIFDDFSKEKFNEHLNEIMKINKKNFGIKKENFVNKLIFKEISYE